MWPCFFHSEGLSFPICETSTVFTHLCELVSHHVPDTPGLVLGSLAQGGHHQGLQILLGQELGNVHTRLHRQQPHRVLGRGSEQGEGRRGPSALGFPCRHRVRRGRRMGSTYLLVRGQVGEHGDDFTLDVVQLQHLGELPQLGGCGPPHHGGVI